MEIFSRPDAQGTHAVVTVDAGEKLTAVNDRGERFLVEGAVLDEQDGFYLVVFWLPYTAVKGQKPWANGIEHGRYSLRVGGEKGETRNLYLASEERDVKAALERELAGGLRTWEAVFNEKGYIPTGMGTGQHWETYSDAGGYAHLISAAAEYVLYLEGKYDWEVHGYPTAPAGR